MKRYNQFINEGIDTGYKYVDYFQALLDDYDNNEYINIHLNNSNEIIISFGISNNINIMKNIISLYSEVLSEIERIKEKVDEDNVFNSDNSKLLFTLKIHTSPIWDTSLIYTIKASETYKPF